jgi:hypothetical protein
LRRARGKMAGTLPPSPEGGLRRTSRFARPTFMLPAKQNGRQPMATARLLERSLLT